VGIADNNSDENILSPKWKPPGLDLDRASAARMYDYYLGGSHNLAVDRDEANEVLAILPQARSFALQNRAFLRRVVHYGVEHGIRQFLDLGAGLPTAGNVHEIARALVPDARVVYVDNDPVAIAHGELLLERNQYATYIDGDVASPNRVLQSVDATKLLNFSQPLMVLMCAVLHFVPDSRQPARIVQAYSDALASGSYLALTHATASDYPEQLAEVVEIYQRTQNQAHLRSRAEITAMLASFEHLVWPGVVYTPQWRPEYGVNLGDPAQSLAFAALARHP
jgi:SAM-dependent methyltransferase